MSDLEDCPKCGSDAVAAVWFRKRGEYKPYGQAIKCWDCNHYGPTKPPGCQAAAAWNTRAKDQPHD